VPDPFISVTDLSDYLGRDLSSDPGAVIATDSACETVRALTGQQFNRGTSTITVDGPGHDALVSPQLPVNSAGTVTVGGTLVTDYVLKDNSTLIRPSSDYTTLTWPEGRQNVTVTFDHGWSPEDLPRDLARVALELAARTVVQGVTEAESVGDVDVRYSVASTDLTEGEQAILRRYRHDDP
jgi:hypothetical protein